MTKSPRKKIDDKLYGAWLTKSVAAYNKSYNSKHLRNWKPLTTSVK